MTGSEHPVPPASLKKFPAEERPGDWLIGGWRVRFLPGTIETPEFQEPKEVRS